MPCKGGVPPLKGHDLERILQRVPEWKAVDEHHINRTFTFPDFKQALAFVNRVGDIAEDQGHHPDIYLTWGKVDITCGRTRSTASLRATSSLPPRSTAHFKNSYCCTG